MTSIQNKVSCLALPNFVCFLWKKCKCIKSGTEYGAFLCHRRFSVLKKRSLAPRHIPKESFSKATKKIVLTHNSQVEPWSSGLWSLEIDTTTINSVIAFAHVKDLQASVFGPRAGIKDNAVMPKDVCVHPMAASDISHAGNVDSTSRICKDEHFQSPPKKLQSELETFAFFATFLHIWQPHHKHSTTAHATYCVFPSKTICKKDWIRKWYSVMWWCISFPWRERQTNSRLIKGWVSRPRESGLVYVPML